MAAKNPDAAAQRDGDFAIDRVFDAPREQVFAALTEIDRLKHWWGPKGFTWIDGTLDLRPGGIFLYGMRSPGGPEMWGKFVYREILRPERLVFVNSFADKSGAVIRSPFAATWPLTVLNTLTLAQQGAKTILTWRGAPVDASEEERKTFASMRPSMHQGFSGTFDQLADHLVRSLGGSASTP